MTVPMKIAPTGDIMESVLLKGDIAKLTPDERVRYYGEVCRSMGLNPLTKPFEFIVLNGKLQLYALRSCADQLRKINGVTLEIISREVAEEILTVHVRAKLPDGRADEDLGAVSYPSTLRGEARANAELKAVTKAKRRATLSICGLGWLDETEVEDIPASAKRPSPPAANVMSNRPPPHDPVTGEIIDPAPAPVGQPPTEEPAPARVGHEGNGAGAADYVTRWETIIDSATNAAQLHKEWGADAAARKAIDWPDDGTFDALKQKVAAAVKFLKEPAAR